MPNDLAIPENPTPMTMFKLYNRKFGKLPDVTIVKITSHNGDFFIGKVRQALKRGKPFSKREEKEIEDKTFAHIRELEAQGYLVQL